MFHLSSPGINSERLSHEPCVCVFGLLTFLPTLCLCIQPSAACVGQMLGLYVIMAEAFCTFLHKCSDVRNLEKETLSGV